MLAEAIIRFPNLGIEIENLSSGFYIGNYRITFYGILIAIGMIAAVVISMIRAKRTNQYTDDYIDIGIITILAAIVGARAYYVLFSLDKYDSFWDVIDIRSGGLAVYGGLIAGIIAAVFVCKYKKISFLRVLDTAVPGIAFAQALGRWGNFFNKEAYGGYTDSLFAMQIKYSEANGVVTDEIVDNLVVVDGVEYIQVHPTFLYESVCCFVIFLLIMIFSHKQRYNGEASLWYVGGYALARAFIEGLRTDQLTIADEIAVSQVLSIILFVIAFVLLLRNRRRLSSHEWIPEYSYELPEDDRGSKQYRENFFNERKANRKNKKKSTWEVEEIKTGTAAAEAAEAENEAAEAAETEAATAEATEAESEAAEAAETEATTAETTEAENEAAGVTDVEAAVAEESETAETVNETGTEEVGNEETGTAEAEPETDAGEATETSAAE